MARLVRFALLVVAVVWTSIATASTAATGSVTAASASVSDSSQQEVQALPAALGSKSSVAAGRAACGRVEARAPQNSVAVLVTSPSAGRFDVSDPVVVPVATCAECVLTQECSRGPPTALDF